ncbi:YsnF/AvaK domain-containing protein [Sodalis glossinidius]|uniref:YsnF/AvaK domain-containing protein n=1 Tax=Sodalis glossinidius TaxID=63612 RepID=UPI0002D9B4B1|nr:YsnF/AvaK domain-containing protein [Sodalis glossinidius]
MSNQLADNSPPSSQREGETSATTQSTLPLAQERLDVAKRQVVQGRVTITRRTTEREEAIKVWLKHENVEIHRVVKGTPLETHPAIREEGDIMIIPVVNEHVEVVRTLVLREEIHIRKVTTAVPYQESVTLRSQDITLEKQRDNE